MLIIYIVLDCKKANYIYLTHKDTPSLVSAAYSIWLLSNYIVCQSGKTLSQSFNGRQYVTYNNF